jgi:hypothetical protein
MLFVRGTGPGPVRDLPGDVPGVRRAPDPGPGDVLTVPRRDGRAVTFTGFRVVTQPGLPYPAVYMIADPPTVIFGNPVERWLALIDRSTWRAEIASVFAAELAALAATNGTNGQGDRK